jgi:hypothetical protein
VAAIVRRVSEHRTALTLAFAAFLVLHGIAHLVGTSSSFTAAADGETVEYLGGLWSISDTATLRVLGVVWSLAGVAWLVPAWAYVVGSPRRRAILVAVALPSLALSIVAVWAAIVGVLVNLVMLDLAWHTRGRGNAAR